jgi:trk system potassium uptake protein TrkH
MSRVLRTAREIARQVPPVRLLVAGYLLYVLVTWALLSLPWSRQAGTVSGLDHLFIATSAVSTTGLITVSTPDAYSWFGEAVVLLAFQLGGLGYMTLGSVFLMVAARPLSRVRERVASVAFALPEGFDLSNFLRRVVIFSLTTELLGAIALYCAFRSEGVQDPAWPAIFHAVSAFCTAGFSVFPDSLESFRASVWVNVIIGTLSLLGAVGFVVVSDAWQKVRRRSHRVTLTTRIILVATALGLFGGWLLFYLVEPTLRSLPTGERLLASGFQAMTSLTTVGFDTHPTVQLGPPAVLLTVALMIVGASPSGTGGGLKSTTVAAGLGVLWSSLTNRSVAFWGRRIPARRLLAAFAASMLYLLLFLVGAFLLLLVEPHTFSDVVFEVASALGTVGLSHGITGALSPAGKLTLIVVMFAGRVGPLTLALAFAARATAAPEVEWPEEDLAV